MSKQTVFIVDDDDQVRHLVVRLVQAAGFDAKAYASAATFLEELDDTLPGCLLLDVTMPGIDGLELQRTLAQRGARLPIVFLTGTANVAIATAGIKAGAIDLVQKPFDNDVLMQAVRAALDVDAQRRERVKQMQEAHARFADLTERELAVLERLVSGRTSKEIGLELALSARTVESHRARIMRKVGVDSVADLVRLRLLATGEQ